jgi:NIPSNAP
VEHELRLYTVKPGEMEEFVAEWKASILPLRRAFGFEVIGPWIARNEDLFIWILGYSGPGGFAAADADYYESEERKALDPNPARHLAKSEHWPMTAA